MRSIPFILTIPSRHTDQGLRRMHSQRIAGFRPRLGSLLAVAWFLLPIPPALAEHLQEQTSSNPIPALRAVLQSDPTSAEAEATRLLSGLRPAGRGDSLVVMDATGILIEARLRLGKYDDPSLLGLLQSLFSLCRSLGGPDSAECAPAHQYAALLARSRGDYVEAIDHYQSAIEIIVRRLGPDHPETARARGNLATAYFAKGDHARARELFEEAIRTWEELESTHPVDLAITLINLNEVKAAQGDRTGVAVGWDRAIEIFEEQEGPDGPGLAETLHRAGIWRLGRHESFEALRALDRAVSIRERAAPRGAELAASLLARARARLELAETDSAATDAMRARRVHETTGDPDDAGVAECLLILGDAARQGSCFDGAVEHYERAIAILKGPPVTHPAELAECLLARAAIALQLGRYDEALDFARQALRLSESDSGADPRDIATARIAYAAALRSAQQPDSAAANFDRALEELTRALGEYDPALSEPLLGLCALARERGDLPRARAFVERALELRKRAYGPEDPRLAECLHELGIAQRRLGDESGAQLSLENAMRLAALRRRDSPETAGILCSIATLERARGDMRAAEEHFREALQIVERILPPQHPQIAQVLRNLASMENATGRFTDAETHYQRALKILESCVPGAPEVAATHVGLGNALKERGKSELAREHYRRAIRIHRDALGPDAPALALDYYNLAVLLLESGDLRAAIDTATVAENLSQRHFRLVARGVSEREALHFAAGRVSGSDIVLTCAARSDSESDWKQAWNVIIRSRAAVLDEIANRRRALAAAPDPAIAALDSALAAASGRLARLAVQGRGKLSPENYQRMFDAARREKDAVERALAERSAPFRSRRKREDAGFSEVTASLPPRSALIAWVRFDRLEHVRSPGGKSAARDPGAGPGVPSYGAFLLAGPDQQIRFVVLGTAEEIDAQITRWHREAGDGPRTRGAEAALRAYAEAGQALRRSVWDPVAAGLEDVDRIFLVPDGALALLNFDALPDDSDGYLVEQAPLLQILSSERDLIREEQEFPCGTGLLTAAAPDYELLRVISPEDARGMREGSATRGTSCRKFESLWFDALPGTLDEEREVARLWHKFGKKVDKGSSGGDRPEIIELVGADATERAFKSQAPGRFILHVATHGFFLDPELMGKRADPGAANPDELTMSGVMAESPLLLSGLAFVGANRREEAPSSDDDGILTAEEVAALNLNGVDCVVLSACETGLGKIEAGEGVFGLRRAFQVAGARSLVMSLWEVDDASTAQWMEVMLEQRLRKRRSVAEAVRAASLKILRKRRGDRLSPHPLYWGAFVAIGDWR